MCLEPRLNWAEASLNVAKCNVEDWINIKDYYIALLECFIDIIQTFSLWTLLAEGFLVISVMALSAMLFFGIFITHSLVVSCATFLVVYITTIVVCIMVFAVTLILIISIFSIDFGVIPSRWFLALLISSVFVIAICIS